MSTATLPDWIRIIEAAYTLDGSDSTWLERLVASAVPALDAGNGVTAQIVRTTPGDVALEAVHVSGQRASKRLVERAIADASAEAVDRVYRSGITAGTLSEVLFAKVPGAAEAFERSNEGRFRDSLGIVAYTGLDHVVALNTPLTERHRMSRAERLRWTRIAAHVGAGFRLRHTVEQASIPDWQRDAVLSPDAAVVDGGSLGASALETLRAFVTRRESALGRLSGGDVDAGLSLWEALVAGHWSLVDRFDSAGRRFVVAVRNEPHVRDPRGLTTRELQIAELAGVGRQAKEIAYVLGVSPSAVNNTITRIRHKLGLASRSDLAAFFAPNGLRARLTRVDVGGEQLLVGSYGASGALLRKLTAAERDVALLLVQGATNRLIAERRKTSAHTVANQIKAIYAKLGVTDRAALAARLSGGL